jgi:non-specific serine/threonine protein kinase
MPVEYAVAEAPGVQDRSGRPRSEVLIDFLRDRELLLVLDNCERVAGECARVVDLMLRAVAELRVKCTSRQPLGTAGEHVWPVLPMVVPKTGAPMRITTRGGHRQGGRLL